MAFFRCEKGKKKDKLIDIHDRVKLDSIVRKSITDICTLGVERSHSKISLKQRKDHLNDSLKES